MELDYAKSEQMQNIIDAFNEFYNHAVAANEFDSAILRDFMESKFIDNGYREFDIHKQPKILILHDNAVGDFINMSAAIREIRRIYPSAYVVLVVSKSVFNLAEFCPYVDEIIVNEMKFSRLYLDKAYIWCLKFAENLLKYRFDVAYAYIFGITPYNHLLAYMSGARERISLVYSKNTQLFSPLLTMPFPFPKYVTHCADVCLSYLEYQLGAPISDRHIEVWISPKDVAKVKNLMPNESNIYAICLGGSHPRKHWAPKFYAELINMIACSRSVAFVILGGPSDIEESTEIMDNLDDTIKVTNLTGKINYRQTAAAISLCKIYIGNDTGAMHAAAALNIPILTPFCFAADIKLPENVIPLSTLKRWYPYNVPSVIVQPKNALPECKNSMDPYGCKITLNKAHCINQITPEIMFEALKLLEKQILNKSCFPIYFN